MLVTKKKIVLRGEFIRHRADCINSNLQEFVAEAAPYIELETCRHGDHDYKITHKAIILQPPNFYQLSSEIVDLLNNGASPDIVARHICHFLIHK